MREQWKQVRSSSLEKIPSPRAIGISSFTSVLQPDSELVEAAALRIAENKDPASYYASSKAAFARWIRRHAITADWVGVGIQLNGIAPGIVETPITQPMLDDKVSRAQLEHVVPMPIGRHGQPEEIAELLL
jgi:NAD(P)-dependent dehydrogenase (short-subunit alcohol dehydrogenase family)